jgi:hypothetical protein
MDTYYGPTKDNPEPGIEYHYGCNGEVYTFKEGRICSRCSEGEDYQEEKQVRDVQPRHTENFMVPGKRIGLRYPSNNPAVLFSRIWTGVTPAHPLIVNYLDAVRDWAMLGNDQWGDCGPVSVANLRALVSRTLLGVEHYPSLDDVLDLYRRSGNPNFPDDDNGVDMQQMLGEVHTNGIGGTKCVAYAKVDITNLDEVRAAIAIFGGLLLGVNLDVAQQSQTDTTKVWDWVPGSAIWGGHAVLAAAYTSLTGKGQGDIGIESWAEILKITDSFWSHQGMEAWVVIWEENLGTTQFMQGVDLKALAADYQALTDQPLPLPTPPAPAPSPSPVPVPPSPTPAPDDVLQEMKRLWHEIGDWLRHHGII